MLSRHQFLSPDLKPVYPQHQLNRYLPTVTAPSLARYSSAKMFERCSTTASELQTHIRKRIDCYTYSSEELIGSGYTSRVYKARKDGSSEVFAIKVVDLKKYSTSNREMLESQVEIVRTLDHPNVIKCHDVFFTLNNCYIITEYCEEGDLLSLIKKNGKGKPFEESRLLPIVKDVLSGFKYLVEKGIVHRDIKPANIFFKNSQCKIADFGFAKRLSKLKSRESYNVGTPLYMPPEALLKNKYSFQSDVFSLGVMIYEMVFGSAPWESRSEKELINKMSRVPLTFPKSIPSGLRELLEGCLATEVTLRFTTDMLFDCSYVQNLFGSVHNPEHAQELFASTNVSLSSTKKLIRHTRLDSKSTTGQDSSSKEDSSGEIQKDRYKQSDALKKLHHDRNTNILLVQVNLCRFMFYLARNKTPLLRKVDKDRLNCILYQHILKVMEKLIESNKINSMKLTEYEQYRSSSSFYKVYNTFCDYEARYKKQYNSFRARMPWQYIELLDSQLGFLKECDSKKVDRDFYRQTSSFVKAKLKQLNSNLSFQIKKPGEDREVGFANSVESLKSLIKYVNLLEMMTNNFEDYQFFMQYSNITVLTDYSKSTADDDLFLQLRDKAHLLTL